MDLLPRDTDGADRWARVLADAGLLGDTRVRHALGELVREEARLTELGHPIGVGVGSVPRRVWVFLGVVTLLFALWLPVVLAAIATAVVVTPFALVGLGLTLRADRRRRVELDVARVECRAAAARLRLLVEEGGMLRR